MGMFIVLDVFQNLDSFFPDQGERNPWEVMGIHYFFVSFTVIDMLLPLLIAMSALGSTVMMLRRNEFTALQGSGVSKLRVMIPFLVGAVMLSGFSLWAREVFIPNHMLESVQTVTELANPGMGISVKQTNDNFTKVELGGEKVFVDENRILNPTISFMVKYFGLEIGEIKGETAIYSPANNEHPAGYLVQNVSKGNNLLGEPSLALRGTGHLVMLTPTDHSWLKNNECFVVSGIDPERLAVGQRWLSLTSTRQLLREMGNPSSNFNAKEIEVNIHTRILRPLADLIPVFIALPFILLRSDRNSLRGLAIGGSLALVFIGIQFLCVYFGPNFDLVVLGPWIPFILFSPVITNVFWNVCH